MDYKIIQQETDKAMNNLKVGMRFHELYSYWIIVKGIRPSGEVVTMEGRGGEPLKFKRYRSKAIFKKFCSYGTIPGYWVDYTDFMKDKKTNETNRTNTG